MRSVLLAFALAACGHGGGYGHGGYGHGGGGGGGGGFGHVVSSASRESHVPSSALSTAENNIARFLPNQVGEAVLASDPPPDNPPKPWVPATDSSGPLIDDHDACNRCPDDFACDQCTGAGGAMCEFSPAGAHARCSTPR